MFNSFVNIFVVPIQRNAFSTEVLEILYQVYFDYYNNKYIVFMNTQYSSILLIS